MCPETNSSKVGFNIKKKKSEGGALMNEISVLIIRDKREFTCSLNLCEHVMRSLQSDLQSAARKQDLIRS